MGGIIMTKLEKEILYGEYDQLLEFAHYQGKKAGDAYQPVPMIVGQAKGILSDEIDYTKPTEYIADGVCGFAWVRTYEHGNGTFVNYLKAKGFAQKCYVGGGYYVKHANASGLYGQGMQKKEAYCRAYAAALEEFGLNAQVESRLD